MDRRTTIKWLIAARAAWPLRGLASVGSRPASAAEGYGTDPDLLRPYVPGELWPLCLNARQKELAALLSDVIIPADERSPSASQVGVVSYIDEWVSAPYPEQQQDRSVILQGLAWIDAESVRVFGRSFDAIAADERQRLCDRLCDTTTAAPVDAEAARFFARYRELTAGAFYSTAAGRRDLNYIGNVPMTSFPPPPPELLRSLDLA
jgi:hypothetical protein